MTLLAPAVRELDRSAISRYLPCLDAWLLPNAFYGVQHTWPQLYRSDGKGRFFAILDGDRLLSHCAVRTVELRIGEQRERVNLLGSVATNPDFRGRGLASAVLQAALTATESSAGHTLLWAEMETLYARAGFVPGRNERGLLLARRPRRALAAREGIVRPATFADHADLLELHQQKPCAVVRDSATMSLLLSTPGLTTFVLERNSRAVAYACTGKGADLHGHWHELGGSDDDIARLLPAAMHLAEQTEAMLLLPPYREALTERLGASVVSAAELQGPMKRALGMTFPAFWIDGLDSV
jgi:GNAT superfamily N-acetyltransferase